MAAQDDRFLADHKIGSAKPRSRAEELVREALSKNQGTKARERLLMRAVELGSFEAYLVLGFDAYTPPDKQKDNKDDSDNDYGFLSQGRDQEQDERDRARAISLFKAAVRAGNHYGWAALAWTFDAAGETTQARNLWDRFLKEMVLKGEVEREGADTVQMLLYLSDSPSSHELLPANVPFRPSRKTLDELRGRAAEMDGFAAESMEQPPPDRDWYEGLAEETGESLDDLLAKAEAEQLATVAFYKALADKARRLIEWLPT